MSQARGGPGSDVTGSVSLGELRAEGAGQEAVVLHEGTDELAIRLERVTETLGQILDLGLKVSRTLSMASCERTPSTPPQRDRLLYGLRSDHRRASAPQSE
jgi:hypothetical protein